MLSGDASPTLSMTGERLGRSLALPIIGATGGLRSVVTPVDATEHVPPRAIGVWTRQCTFVLVVAHVSAPLVILSGAKNLGLSLCRDASPLLSMTP
ncbi:MAG: hypothetical protein RMM06_04775 [Armatimonadota bacterium]|nr:hypothetical protein [Armatimonadota bacterium]